MTGTVLPGQHTCETCVWSCFLSPKKEKAAAKERGIAGGGGRGWKDIANIWRTFADKIKNNTQKQKPFSTNGDVGRR